MKDPEAYDRLMATFEELKASSAYARAARLEQLGKHDPTLVGLLEALLEADAEIESPLERAAPLDGVADTVTPDARAGASGEALPAAVGDTVGLYRLTGVLGRGGMGCVYIGQHVELVRPVAVKVLDANLAEDDDYVSRFLHEAKIVNAVRHPNIVDIFDFIDEPSPRRVALVMELLHGRTLARILTQRALTTEEAIDAMLQLCAGLTAVHSLGVVHRDLKPDNVMVVGPLAPDPTITQGDSAATVKLLDFGIAKVSDPMAVHRTATGAVLGTPAYMAPEQFSAEAPTAATDVYALGELLFEMLTGRPLFPEQGLAMVQTKMNGVRSPPGLPRTVAHERVLRGVIFDCLQVDPSLRPSLAHVQQTLAALRPASVRARSGRVERPAPWADHGPVEAPQRGRWGLFAGLGVVALAAGGLAVGLGPAVTALRGTTEDVSAPVVVDAGVGPETYWTWATRGYQGWPVDEIRANAGGRIDEFLASFRDNPGPSTPVAEVEVLQAGLPAIIYGDEPSDLPFTATGFMGNARVMHMDPHWPEHPHSGNTSLRVTYTESTGWAGVAWMDPPFDWGRRPGGRSFVGAKRLSVWIRGSRAGQGMRIGYGIVLRDHPYYDTTRTELLIELNDSWTEYVFDLKGRDLSRLKCVFYFAFAAEQQPVEFFIDDIRFE